MPTTTKTKTKSMGMENFPRPSETPRTPEANNERPKELTKKKLEQLIEKDPTIANAITNALPDNTPGFIASVTNGRQSSGQVRIMNGISQVMSTKNKLTPKK
jgi:hypothetical protein